MELPENTEEKPHRMRLLLCVFGQFHALRGLLLAVNLPDATLIDQGIIQGA